ncbi:DUF4011 domain-containing protein [Autumnicola psychrophila]|uniref:DUF3320 domain-containing protein n=1 Tax=Autumnicola psychrophila TaxID=3075592 RepID=A0ABU3DW51_9FLAO|nr:DUF3320 domain-containing protein [Zunongwangia sp. F225]MDT0687674.1 DUF3320 domain-containing protein [Zunongwangia sp. F225]
MNIQLDLLARERMNLALLQNRIPLIQKLQIGNDTEDHLENLKLKIISDPQGVLSGEIAISSIPPGETFIVENPVISHSWDYFRNVTEKIRGRVLIDLLDAQGNTIAKTFQDLEIEPESVWLGQQAPLELLVSHIMPNSEVVQRINRKAADFLKELTGNSALSGYQSKDRERVYQTAQAIYQAIREKNITYSEAPASFEDTGQKIRTPEQILKHSMANCLDISLFYAACLEQAGIHSLVFIIQGHAFAGFWLEDKFLPRPLEEDAQFYRKRMELDEMAAIEITNATADINISFSQLESLGKDHFKNEENFICGIDVTHCRRHARIHPLNDSASLANRTTEKRELRKEEAELESRRFKEFQLPENVEAREKELDKWKDKLLDLSFRNRLLNFRPNKGTVEILCHSPNEIEDILADGAAFEILPEPRQSSLNLQRTDQQEILTDQITLNFERKKLLTKISETKFQAVLNSLYRSVVNAEEETGANTLFLALGILSWKETDRSQTERRSPLLLLPVNLRKKTVGGKFSLSLRDDDTVLNYTLLQKLKRDFDLEFPGLDPLPEDESGVNVQLIFDIIRKIIRDKRGWEVKEEVWLSEFSFQKYLMWKELDNHYEDMLKSPVIRTIMTSEAPKEIPEFVSEDKVEELLHPKDMYCPLSADSSQMAAVLSAANGNTFVLQGPPGTGKSQTIANMIAHCIGIGKRVLFVSEKKVALEVVYRRLQEIGIGPFCLELHSKKSEKKEVVKSFYNALEFNSDGLNGEWDQVSEELKTSRDGLNNYFRELHEISPSGISAYKAFGLAARSYDMPKVDLEFKSFLEYPLAELRELVSKLKNWEEFAESLTNEEYLAWATVQKKEWNSRTEDVIIQLLNKIHSLIKELERISADANHKLPLNPKWKIVNWLALGDFVDKILATPEITSGFLKQGDFPKYQSEFYENLEHLKNQAETRQKLEKIFQAKVFQENFYELKQQLQETREGFFLISFFKKLKLKGRLKNLIKDKLEPLEKYDQYFEAGIKYQEGLIKEEKASRFVKEAIGEEYQLTIDGKFRKAMAWAEDVNKDLLALYSSDFGTAASAKAFITTLVKNRSLALAESSEIKKELVQKHEFLIVMRTNLNLLKDELELKPECFEVKAAELAQKLEAIQNSFSLFRDVTTMNVLKSELSQAGLNPLFENVDKGEISKSNIYQVFNYNFHRQWLQEKSEDSNTLNSTTGLQLNKLDSDFKNLDLKYRAYTEKALSGKISADKPRMGNLILPDSPVGLIVKENKKSRRHLPIRKFLDSISSVAQTLKPCYLMSPMSVSQYLPVSPDFDIVIFDEASQIPPWDAIGALSRGKQAIIVGDTKQLPPTAFFSMKSEDESDEKIDCESVLEMFGSIYPEMLLKWHYRSRSESLISFSNHHIYDNRLNTFPASDTEDDKVSLMIVTGKEAFYDKGKSKTNVGEANAVVDEIFSRLKEESSTGSIGVVTFSSVQANLISDLIDVRLQKEPQFETFFDVNNPEYIFVKNLENVQGDERDLILFSVGYGKDSLGKISRNFGPLNNSGGERRLNVAVTRARNEVKIFSNFHPRELDVSTSTSEGLRLLKEYLLYAQEGHTALLRQQSFNNVDEFDSIFEKEVTDALRKKGWEVRTQIGVGGYRVDLGVVHPEYSGRFLAGIECDGARFHSAKSARDRDILRQMVLEGLGWAILRIWSTDWWYDSGKCIDKLHQELEALLAAPREAIKKAVKDIAIPDSIAENENSNSQENEMDVLQENLPPVVNSQLYDPTMLEINPIGEFFENANLVSNQMKGLVQALAPVSREECFSKVSRSWGFARRGNRIDQFLETCSKGIHRTKSNGQIFFWNTPEDVGSIEALRLPPEGQQRHPSSIAPEELLHGFTPILQSNIEVSKDLLFKEVAKMLGYSRISKENMKYMEPALELLKNQDMLTTEDEVVLWRG